MNNTANSSISPVPYWRLSGFYFCFFGLLGALFPFWPLYLQQFGFSATEIGLLLAIPMATKILAPNFWSWLAEHTGQRLLVIRCGALMSALFFAGFLVVYSFWGIAFLIVGYSFFWNAVLPQKEVITTHFLRKNPERYSRVRLWGSIGFIITGLGCGLWFENHDLSSLPLIGLVLLLGGFIASLLVPSPETASTASSKSPFIPTLRDTSVAAFFVMAALMQFSHGIYYSFFSLFMELQGYSRTTISLLWAAGVIAEVVLFLLMHRLLLAMGVRLILLGCLMIAACRWLLIASFPDSLWLLFLAQCAHAFTFGAFHAACIDTMRQLFNPQHHGNAQALYSAFCLGAGGACGSVLGGLLWDTQPAAVFMLGALVCLLGAAIFWHYFSSPETSHST